MVSSTQSLAKTHQQLRGYALLSSVASLLDANRCKITQEMGETVRERVDAFEISANPDVLPQMATHAAQHTAELARLLRGEKIGNFEFVREHARLRAEQRFPLEATLHAYRCGHRTYQSWMRRALDELVRIQPSSQIPSDIYALLADFSLEYTDTISTIAAAEYVAQVRHLADLEGDRRSRLLTILLDGYDESDGRVTNILRDAGYLAQRLAFCVVVAQPVNVDEMLNAARARRLADALAKLLNSTPHKHIVDVRELEVVAIVTAIRRTSGWTAPRRALGEQLAALLQQAGPAILIGVSDDAPSTSQVPQAYQQARLSMEMAHVGARVQQYSSLRLRDQLIHLSREPLARALPRWQQSWLDSERRAKGALSDTLRAYADANMNALQAARALGAHPNTLYARIDRIQSITGLDPRCFHDLVDLLLMIDSGKAR